MFMSSILKRVLLTFIFIFNLTYCYGIEDVELIPEAAETSTGLNYLSDVYYGKIENENVSPILKLFSEKGMVFENSKINSVKATFLYSGHLFYNKTEHLSSYATHDFSAVEPMIIMKFNDNKSKAMFDFNFTRNLNGYSNWFTQRISQAYISHDITPNQTILFGQGERLPNTYDGCLGIMGQEMAYKSQLGRTFGESRSVGIRNIAKYKYVDYDIGLYDSTRYMKEFGNGLDFTGYILFKPFQKHAEKIGNFKLGSGYNIGYNNISYNNYSVMAGYDYKNFHLRTEYANADGYNAGKESKNNADGFYTLLSYDITPKISLLFRYDYFTGNKEHKNSYSQEYSGGITYKMFKNMKIMINYVNKQNSDKPDSNMILFATRFII